MPVSQYYVDPLAGVDAPGGGAIGAPWKKVQYALNTIVRNAVDGDQVNIKAGAADVLAASLTLATYGAPAVAAPLILRGYTAVANDGGIGEIDCGGFTMWAGSYSYIFFIDLEMHTFGNNNGIAMNAGCVWRNCEIHKGASAPAGKNLVTGNYSGILQNCYLHGTGTGLARGVGYVSAVNSCFIVMDAGTGEFGIDATTFIYNTILVLQSAGAAVGIRGATQMFNNVVYSQLASTGAGIDFLSGASVVVFNNIVCGFSGVGGKGIGGTNIAAVGYNAFWNNTANYAITDQRFIDLTAFDVALGANPFTNAAGGDFSLTTAAQAALRDVGWSAAYLGAHANTDGHITIGPIQYGAAVAGGGAVSISPYRGNL